MSSRTPGGWSRDDGAVAVITAVMIVALLGLAAIVVDAGAVYAHRRQLQTAADAAALAGVQDLPASKTDAESAAETYASANSAVSEEITIAFPDDYTIRATVRDPDLGLFFARFLGMETTPVNATATARVGSPTTYGSGVMPFGVMANGSVEPPYGLEGDPSDYGSFETTLKTNPLDASQGNFHTVDLLAFWDGPNTTPKMIEGGGTVEEVSIGQVLSPQTGNVVPNLAALASYIRQENVNQNQVPLLAERQSSDGLSYNADKGVWEPITDEDARRLITVPVIAVGTNPADVSFDWELLNGSSVEVVIIGFAQYYIEAIPSKDDPVIKGVFVQTIDADALGHGDYVDWAGVVRWLDE